MVRAAPGDLHHAAGGPRAQDAHDGEVADAHAVRLARLLEGEDDRRTTGSGGLGRDIDALACIVALPLRRVSLIHRSQTLAWFWS